MLVERALLDGLVFSLLFGAMITLIQVINPRYELHNYPPAIRGKVPPKTEEERRAFKKLAVPMLLLLLAFFLGRTIQAYAARPTTYFILFSHSFVIIMTWNLFDLFIMDWLVFCTLTPGYLVIPGTEGNPAYRDYRYHINGSLGKGLLLAVLAAAAGAGISWLLLRLFLW